jgi:hypothetical protein
VGDARLTFSIGDNVFVRDDIASRSNSFSVSEDILYQSDIGSLGSTYDIGDQISVHDGKYGLKSRTTATTGCYPWAGWATDYSLTACNTRWTGCITGKGRTDIVLDCGYESPPSGYTNYARLGQTPIVFTLIRWYSLTTASKTFTGTTAKRVRMYLARFGEVDPRGNTLHFDVYVNAVLRYTVPFSSLGEVGTWTWVDIPFGSTLTNPTIQFFVISQACPTPVSYCNASHDNYIAICGMEFSAI